MAELILEPTPQAQWQALVHEAQSACDRHLDETLENYLVFLLMRFADKPHCTARIMAADYLNSQTLPGEQRADKLRDVGDHCLLFSGLFPQLAERRLVRISYFVNIGRAPTGNYQTDWIAAGLRCTAICPRRSSCWWISCMPCVNWAA